ASAFAASTTCRTFARRGSSLPCEVLEAAHERDERLGDAREERRIGLRQHRAISVERRVGERRRVAEQERARGERRERRRQERTRLRDELVAIALPRFDAPGAELALLEQHV